MTIKKAKELQQTHKLVKHRFGTITGYISCFDDEETGVYIKPSYSFIPLKDLEEYKSNQNSG